MNSGSSELLQQENTKMEGSEQHIALSDCPNRFCSNCGRWYDFLGFSMEFPDFVKNPFFGKNKHEHLFENIQGALMAEPFLKGGSKVLERLLDLENVALQFLGGSVNLDMAEPRRRVKELLFFFKAGWARKGCRTWRTWWGLLLVLRFTFIT